MSLKQTISRHLINLPGWRTSRKIVVIESDDWGSIRMPSREVYEKLLKAGIRVDHCPYNRYDSLESMEDIDDLFNVLMKFRDKKGNHPIVTANTVVANPDFEKIKESGFKHFFFEPFTETLKKYPAHQNSFSILKQGIDSGVYFPQFHGREHVNIPLWLSLLRSNNHAFRLAFDLGLWGIGPNIINSGKIHIQASFDAIEKAELFVQNGIIKDGLLLFQQIFGFPSKSFIANNFIWDTRLNHVLAESGVTMLQGMKYQIYPLLDNRKRKLVRHFTGEVNTNGQVYLVRNCVFEPTQYPRIHSVSTCMSDIANAFFWNTPAIISAHRLNFMGYLEPKNKDNNLSLLQELLSKILKRWPDVEFMSSDQLGNLIRVNPKSE